MRLNETVKKKKTLRYKYLFALVKYLIDLKK